MPSKKENKAALILVIFIVCIPFLLGFAYRFRNELKIDERLMQLKDAIFSNEGIYVRLNLLAGVNNKDLRIVFSIPCKDEKTKQDILDNMTVIKHEMLMSMDDARNKISVEKRDFQRIKANCLAVLNRYAPVDINRVYVEFFALN